MSRRNKQRKQNGPNEAQALDALAKSKKSFVTADGYQNVFAKVGISSDNQSSGGTYGFGGFITRNRILLDAAYRTSWIIGRVVDVVAEDMTKAGIDITTDLEPSDVDTLKRGLVQLGIWKNLTSAIKWGRLYGGSAAIIVIEGQDFSKPLNIDTVGKDSFKGLIVLDRWLLNPSLDNLVTDYGPDFGMPKFYDIIPTSTALRNERVHYSRIIRFEGVELPYLWRQAENMWSASIIERMYDRLLAFDSTTQGIAQLIFKAHLRTVRLKGLREALAAGGPMEDAIVKEIEYIRRFQTNEGITLLDADDEFETHQYAFSGLDSVLIQFGQQISGATEIPMVKIFGQSPSGFNSGDSDLRNYNDDIERKQEAQLHEPLNKILRIMAKSKLQMALPDATTIKFTSLQKMSDKEKSDIGTAVSNAVTGAHNAGIIKKATALKELKQSSNVSGLFSNITDEEIEAAENEPDMLPGEDIPGEISETGELSEVEKTLKELVESDKEVHAKAGFKDSFSKAIAWINSRVKS